MKVREGGIFNQGEEFKNGSTTAPCPASSNPANLAELKDIL
jgi:hypothetical protein